MKKLLTLALALFLVATPSSGQIQLDSIVRMDSVTPGLEGASCTAFAIGPKKWMTSTHCLAERDRLVPTIDGDRVYVVDEKAGATTVRTIRATGLPLKLARVAPKEGDIIRVKGFPFGFSKPILTGGLVGAVEMHVPEFEDRGLRLIVSAVGAPGSSGSPVLDARGEVIGVIESGWGRDFSPILAATPWSALKEIW